MTPKQYFLRREHGTPEEFEDEVMKAEAAGLISSSTARDAVAEYKREWEEAAGCPTA